MGKLHKKARKGAMGSLIRGIVGDKTFDKFHPIGTSLEKSYDQSKAAEAAVKEAQNEKAIPLPDEEELKRQRRRMGSRRGGRASTVLSDEDRLGGY